MISTYDSAATGYYVDLVEHAIQERVRRRSGNKHEQLLKSISIASLSDSKILTSIAEELHRINEHIEVDPGLVTAAAKDYAGIGHQLVTNLDWEPSDITVLPQGSSSTLTLIRSPSAEKFDIDAVCKVLINRSQAWDPMRFFDQFGPALANRDAIAKNRCWRIEGLSPRYYIEFTPSVPLECIPQTMLQVVRYRPSRYLNTALAVVDRPSKQWKTSNPEGLAQWVEEQSKRQLVLAVMLAKNEAYAMERVKPVPEQSVPLHDTLRVAIRLFKRHRDMMVDRGELSSELKPISIILVTLLTQCYEGLANKQQRYYHHLELLRDLIELLPGMVEQRNGTWWIENPTVAGENFAERWNDDGGARKAAFETWCEQLLDDLVNILEAPDETAVKERIRKVFGTTSASAPTPRGGGLATGNPSSPAIAPAGQGLA